MPSVTFTQPHEWRGRDVPAGTTLNLTVEDLAALKKLGVANETKPIPAPEPEDPEAMPKAKPAEPATPDAKPAAKKETDR